MNKNSLILGIALGICVPIVGFALIQILFEQLAIAGILNESGPNLSPRRLRTISLLGICCIIIPFEISRRKRYDQTLRGMIFPIMLYVFYWLYYFRDSFYI
jgi:hypothetical protein